MIQMRFSEAMDTYFREISQWFAGFSRSSIITWSRCCHERGGPFACAAARKLCGWNQRHLNLRRIQVHASRDTVQA
jgi:hypothetical protein